jgi:hypothetical protein
MSIIAAFVSGQGAIVASDGRMFTSARFDGGKIVEQPKIGRDDFDKTFNFNNNIIGAYCGLLSFSGLTTSTHITEILSGIKEPSGDFENIIRTLGENFRNRLLSIPSNEVLFKFRHVDAIFVGRVSKKAMEAIKMRFIPNHSDICIENIPSIIKNDNRYFLFGNDTAQKGAINIFANNKAQNHDLSFLSKLIMKAIKAGITSSSKFNQEKECGGTIFRKQIN